MRHCWRRRRGGRGRGELIEVGLLEPMMDMSNRLKVKSGLQCAPPAPRRHCHQRRVPHHPLPPHVLCLPLFHLQHRPPSASHCPRPPPLRRFLTRRRPPLPPLPVLLPARPGPRGKWRALRIRYLGPPRHRSRWYSWYWMRIKWRARDLASCGDEDCQSQPGNSRGRLTSTVQ